MKKLVTTLGALCVIATTYGQIQTNTVETKLAVVPYVTYIEQPQKWGGGVLGVYNIHNNVGVIVGLDYVDQFLAINGGLQLQLPLRPFESLGYSNVVVTPVLGTAIGTSPSGAGDKNGNVQNIYFTGGKLDLFKYKGHKVFAGGAYGTRTGAGAYSGNYFNAFLGGTF